LLALHRMTWNDLVEQLRAAAPEAWVRTAPAEEPAVDPLELLVALFRDFVEFCEPHECLVTALWVLATHVYDRFTVTPRLVLRSPTAACGKSTLMNLMLRTAARAEKFDFISVAAVYRIISERHPTMLFDEVDNLALALAQNGRLRAVFNSGHGCNGTGTLWDPRAGADRKFSTFCPLAMALPDTMGGLHRTLESRAITIFMQRADGSRPLRRLDINGSAPELDRINGQILRWAREVKLDLNPDMPNGMRFADNWRPLVSCADSLSLNYGLNYGAMVRKAIALMERSYRDADVKVQLLSDIRKVFNANRLTGLTRLTGKELLAKLHILEGSDWSEFSGVAGDQQLHKLRDTEMASMLRSFHIRPSNIWRRDDAGVRKSARGYKRSDFEAAWQMYCREDGTAAHPSNIRHLR
jgi:hypothetical protein